MHQEDATVEVDLTARQAELLRAPAVVGLEGVGDRPEPVAGEVGAPERLERIAGQRVRIEVEHARDLWQQLGQEEPVPHG